MSYLLTRGAYHLSELAGQISQFVTRMHLFEDLFLQVHQKGAYYSQIYQSGRPVLAKKME